MSRPMVIDGPVTQVDSTPDSKKYGLTRWEYSATYGWQEWIYVKNVEAATNFAAGNVIMSDTTETTPGKALVCATSTSVHRVIGVAQHAIAFGSAGWIVKTGLCLVLADTGGFTADTGLIPGNAVAGAADDVGGATAVAFGLALATTLATATGIARVWC